MSDPTSLRCSSVLGLRSSNSRSRCASPAAQFPHECRLSPCLIVCRARAVQRAAVTEAANPANLALHEVSLGRVFPCNFMLQGRTTSCTLPALSVSMPCNNCSMR